MTSLLIPLVALVVTAGCFVAQLVVIARTKRKYPDVFTPAGGRASARGRSRFAARLFRLRGGAK